MKKLIISLLVILLIIILAIAGVYLFSDVLNADKIIVNEIDLTDIEDGSYEGTYETPLVKATVRVNIISSNIVKIDLLRHENGLGKKAESILFDVARNNSVLVDTISGATYSSKVILKAIENAISNIKN
ncbi:MAG: FMN-binding protein [Clostridia bacterium]|nr:FMN-binding protein [Clostridia bacterium]